MAPSRSGPNPMSSSSTRSLNSSTTVSVTTPTSFVSRLQARAEKQMVSDSAVSPVRSPARRNNKNSSSLLKGGLYKKSCTSTDSEFEISANTITSPLNQNQNNSNGNAAFLYFSKSSEGQATADNGLALQLAVANQRVEEEKRATATAVAQVHVLQERLRRSQWAQSQESTTTITKSNSKSLSPSPSSKDVWENRSTREQVAYLSSVAKGHDKASRLSQTILGGAGLSHTSKVRTVGETLAKFTTDVLSPDAAEALKGTKPDSKRKSILSRGGSFNHPEDGKSLSEAVRDGKGVSDHQSYYQMKKLKFSISTEGSEGSEGQSQSQGQAPALREEEGTIEGNFANMANKIVFQKDIPTLTDRLSILKELVKRQKDGDLDVDQINEDGDGLVGDALGGNGNNNADSPAVKLRSAQAVGGAHHPIIDDKLNRNNREGDVGLSLTTISGTVGRPNLNASTRHLMKAKHLNHDILARSYAAPLPEAVDQYGRPIRKSKGGWLSNGLSTKNLKPGDSDNNFDSISNDNPLTILPEPAQGSPTSSGVVFLTGPKIQKSSVGIVVKPAIQQLDPQTMVTLDSDARTRDWRQTWEADGVHRGRDRQIRNSEVYKQANRSPSAKMIEELGPKCPQTDSQGIVAHGNYRKKFESRYPNGPVVELKTNETPKPPQEFIDFENSIACEDHAKQKRENSVNHSLTLLQAAKGGLGCKKSLTWVNNKTQLLGNFLELPQYDKSFDYSEDYGFKEFDGFGAHIDDHWVRVQQPVDSTCREFLESEREHEEKRIRIGGTLKGYNKLKHSKSNTSSSSLSRKSKNQSNSNLNQKHVAISAAAGDSSSDYVGNNNSGSSSLDTEKLTLRGKRRSRKSSKQSQSLNHGPNRAKLEEHLKAIGTHHSVNPEANPNNLQNDEDVWDLDSDHGSEVSMANSVSSSKDGLNVSVLMQEDERDESGERDAFGNTSATQSQKRVTDFPANYITETSHLYTRHQVHSDIYNSQISRLLLNRSLPEYYRDRVLKLDGEWDGKECESTAYLRNFEKWAEGGSYGDTSVVNKPLNKDHPAVGDPEELVKISAEAGRHLRHLSSTQYQLLFKPRPKSVVVSADDYRMLAEQSEINSSGNGDHNRMPSRAMDSIFNFDEIDSPYLFNPDSVNRLLIQSNVKLNGKCGRPLSVHYEVSQTESALNVPLTAPGAVRPLLHSGATESELLAFLPGGIPIGRQRYDEEIRPDVNLNKMENLIGRGVEFYGEGFDGGRGQLSVRGHPNAVNYSGRASNPNTKLMTQLGAPTSLYLKEVIKEVSTNKKRKVGAEHSAGARVFSPESRAKRKNTTINEMTYANTKNKHNITVASDLPDRFRQLPSVARGDSVIGKYRQVKPTKMLSGGNFLSPTLSSRAKQRDRDEIMRKKKETQHEVLKSQGAPGKVAFQVANQVLRWQRLVNNENVRAPKTTQTVAEGEGGSTSDLQDSATVAASSPGKLLGNLAHDGQPMSSVYSNLLALSPRKEENSAADSAAVKDKDKVKKTLTIPSSLPAVTVTSLRSSSSAVLSPTLQLLQTFNVKTELDLLALNILPPDLEEEISTVVTASSNTNSNFNFKDRLRSALEDNMARKIGGAAWYWLASRLPIGNGYTGQRVLLLERIKNEGSVVGGGSAAAAGSAGSTALTDPQFVQTKPTTATSGVNLLSKIPEDTLTSDSNLLNLNTHVTQTATTTTPVPTSNKISEHPTLEPLLVSLSQVESGFLPQLHRLLKHEAETVEESKFLWAVFRELFDSIAVRRMLRYAFVYAVLPAEEHAKIVGPGGGADESTSYYDPKTFESKAQISSERKMDVELLRNFLHYLLDFAQLHNLLTVSSSSDVAPTGSSDVTTNSNSEFSFLRSQVSALQSGAVSDRKSVNFSTKNSVTALTTSYSMTSPLSLTAAAAAAQNTPTLPTLTDAKEVSYRQFEFLLPRLQQWGVPVTVTSTISSSDLWTKMKKAFEFDRSPESSNSRKSAAAQESESEGKVFFVDLVDWAIWCAEIGRV